MSRYPKYLVCSCTRVWSIYLDFVWRGLQTCCRGNGVLFLGFLFLLIFISLCKDTSNVEPSLLALSWV